jgi:hypothetical protein
VAKTTVSSGFGLTLGGSLSVTVEEGSASNLALRGELPFDYTFNVADDATTWLTFDIDNEAVIQRTGTEPEIDATEVWLWKIIASSGSVTSTVDLRTIRQSVLPDSIDSLSVSPAKITYLSEVGNIVPNGEFAIWSPPFGDQDAYPPDRWETCYFNNTASTVTEDEDLWSSSGSTQRVYYDTTNTQTGDTSIEVDIDTTDAGNTYGLKLDEKVPVTEGQLYMFQLSGYVGNSLTSRMGVRWYDKDGSFVSSTAPSFTVGAGAATWNTWRYYRRAPSTATNLEVLFGLSAAATGTAYYDYLRVAKTGASFRAYKTTTGTVAAGAWSLQSLQVEEHDHGNDFGTGSGEFVAKNDGVYVFSARCQIQNIPNNDYCKIGIYIGSTAGGVPTPGTGTEVSTTTFYNTSGGALTEDLTTAVQSLELVAGQRVAMYVYWADLGSATGTLNVFGSGAGSNGTYTTYFSGQEKREL